jgi:signal transduction histidine kinase
MFTQVGRGTENPHGGLGIGLTIVKRLVEMHGGHIWVESRVGAGTTFYFTLPAAQPAGAQPTRAEMY